MIKQQLSSFLFRLQTFYRSKLWRGRLILALTIFVVLISIVRITLPHTIIYSATSWLKQQGIESTIESINIDIINGSFSIVNATGSENGSPLFNVGLIDIHWRWTPLSKKTIVVSKVVLDHFNVSIKKYGDKIIVGGVQIPLGSQATEVSVNNDTDENAKPWAASLGEVVFTNLNICYLQHTTSHDAANLESKYLDYCVNLDEMTWGGTISYATDAELLKTDDLALSSTGNFALNGLTVTDNKVGSNLLVSASNTLNNVVISGLRNIHIDNLSMTDLSALQRDDVKHKDAVRFHQIDVSDINLADLNVLSVNDIKISEPGLYLVKNDEHSWEYQQWLPQTVAPSSPAENTATSSSSKTTSPFRVSINNINIKNIDSCYLEKESALYYCFVFDELDWDGKIKYDTLPAPSGAINLTASGDLTLTNPNIHNESIDRTLIDFSSLALTNINLTELNAITLDSLKLARFTALQRSEKKDDNTVSFETLAINNVNYSKNKIAIDTIKLDGLSDTISKNPDGTWEHNKWFANTNTTETDTTSKQGADKKQDFIISLKKLLVSSDKKSLFIDNSTKPAMQGGLQALSLDVRNLDSTKPDIDSPISLSATTTRHATIKIDGTARPLAKKVSFTLDGKLKGFDLRSASPATTKAIGHIIKSGQLDADLTLHATEGELDSNIALSLYQFHIKAKSKADAEKLNASIGMPLNQTLVLLRNKDDSIHLDIPITGDINNPNFNPMDAIVVATTKAATVTLITFYTPYGLIYAGGNVLFDIATAMNFDPIEFEAGSAEIHGDNTQKLENLTKLLTEKPGIHLTLCGVTNHQDALTLFPELKKQKPDAAKAEIVLSEEQLAVLEKLARDRQINAKNSLIKEGNIAHDRLILCAPEHKTDKDAVAGVEINI